MTNYLLTVWVDYGDDVEVEVIQYSPRGIVAPFIAIDELQREILNRLDRLCQPDASGG